MANVKVATKQKTAKNGKRKNKSAVALAERRRLVKSIRGKYAWIPYSSEDFIRDKPLEIALENRA